MITAMAMDWLLPKNASEILIKCLLTYARQRRIVNEYVSSKQIHHGLWQPRTKVGNFWSLSKAPPFCCFFPSNFQFFWNACVGIFARRSSSQVWTSLLLISMFLTQNGKFYCKKISTSIALNLKNCSSSTILPFPIVFWTGKRNSFCTAYTMV